MSPFDLEHLRWTYEAARNDYMAELRRAGERTAEAVRILKAEADAIRRDAEALELKFKGGN